MEEKRLGKDPVLGGAQVGELRTCSKAGGSPPLVKQGWRQEMLALTRDWKRGYSTDGYHGETVEKIQ